MQRRSTRLVTILNFMLLAACNGELTADPAAEAQAGALGTPVGELNQANQDRDVDADSDADGSTPAAVAETWEGMRVGTNFWFLSSWGEEAWKPNVDFATTTDPWNPAFIADLEEANYAVYRFMDFGGTNHSKIRDWSERTQMDSKDNQSGGDVEGRGIAYEWMFDLCNRMQKACWITVPHLAIETYEKDPTNNHFTELAKLAKENLDPGLTLYIEYSNETWNYGFEQAHYCKKRGEELKFDEDPYAAAFKFHVFASSRMNDAFVKVFGNQSARVKWVVAGQLSQAYGTEKQVDALRDPKINLGARMPAYYSISNYVGSDNKIDGASSTMPADFRAGIKDTLKWTDDAIAQIKGTGMQLVSYEGGQHLLKNADTFSRNPVTYDLYKEWLDAMTSKFILTMHYANSGSYADNGAWGAKEKTGQAISESPKARALRDWIAAHPTE